MLRRKQRPAALPISVNVVNDQDEHLIDAEQWSALVSNVLGAEGIFGPGELNLLFVGLEEMSALNKLHMGKDGPTDVLSFPIDAGDDLDDADERMVGDIVVCPSVAFRQAPQHAGTYPDEVALLLVHGTLHLLGHDHAGDEERDAMWAREQELLAQFYGPLPRNPWAE